MKKEIMTVTSVKKIADETYEMVLKNDYISENAIPGQFLHISIPNFTLRRPISIADIDRESETVTIIYKRVGEGTDALTKFSSGMQVDVLGPRDRKSTRLNSSHVA